MMNAMMFLVGRKQGGFAANFYPPSSPLALPPFCSSHVLLLFSVSLQFLPFSRRKTESGDVLYKRKREGGSSNQECHSVYTLKTYSSLSAGRVHSGRNMRLPGEVSMTPKQSVGFR